MKTLDVYFGKIGNKVFEAVVDDKVAEVFTQHKLVLFLSDQRKPRPPRVSGLGESVLLHRLVWTWTLDGLCLSEHQLRERLNRIQRLSFLNNNPFDCRFENLCGVLGNRSKLLTATGEQLPANYSRKPKQTAFPQTLEKHETLLDATDIYETRTGTETQTENFDPSDSLDLLSKLSTAPSDTGPALSGRVAKDRIEKGEL